MRIKCARCNQKTIYFSDMTKSYTHRCSNCDAELIIDLNKYFSISVFTIIPTLMLIGFKIKPSHLHLYFSFYIVMAMILLIVNVTAYTKLKPHSYKPPAIALKHASYTVIGVIVYLTLVLFVSNPIFQFVLNFVGILLLIWLHIVFKKASQNKD